MGRCVPYPPEHGTRQYYPPSQHHGYEYRAYRPPNDAAGGAPAPPPPIAAPAPPLAPLGGGQRARPPAADGGVPVVSAPPRPMRIWDTGYAILPRIGGEASGYGLYSYAILPSPSPWAASFLAEVFR